VVAENIHTRFMDGYWKFRGGGGSKRPKFLKESMKLNWNFQRGGGLQSKKPIHGGGMDIFWNLTLLVNAIGVCHLPFTCSSSSMLSSNSPKQHPCT